MPQERQKEPKCSDTSATDPVSWWQKFHFSGKVIMCSVLFGLGLVLIGGLVLAIGADRHGEKNENLNEVQNKAPMSIVGPIIMGIGSFTVLVGIIMCLFETDICRKRQPDSRPLIEEQSSEARNADGTPIPSTSHKREKYRHHKKSSSSKKHKATSSPSSMPIDTHRSLSRDLTTSDTFLTPPSSLIADHNKQHPTYSDADIQTSSSLLKSFTSSGNTSADFQTPPSSFQESSESLGDRYSTLEPEHKELSNQRLKNLKHEFVTPKNSSAEFIDEGSLKEKALKNFHQPYAESEELYKESQNKPHDFVTPINSYVDKFNVAELDASKDNPAVNFEKNTEKPSKQKSSTEDVSSSKTDIRIVEETLNNESIIPTDLKTSHGLKEPANISDNAIS